MSLQASIGFIKRLHLQGIKWVFSVVYASPREKGKKDLWEALHHISTTMTTSWLVGGDLNDILDSNDKKRRSE